MPTVHPPRVATDRLMKCCAKRNGVVGGNRIATTRGERIICRGDTARAFGTRAQCYLRRVDRLQPRFDILDLVDLFETVLPHYPDVMFDILIKKHERSPSPQVKVRCRLERSGNSSP